MKSSPFPGLALLLAIPGCASPRHSETASISPPTQMSWREIATSADRDRIARWRNGWTAALAKVEASGNGGKIAAHGALMQPDAALSDPVPPPGDYVCRVTKL